MSKLKSNNKNKCCRGNDKQELVHCWWECKLAQSLWKLVRRFLKKLEIELSYDLVIPLLGIYPKDHMTGYDIVICTLMFITTLLTVAKF
jgi:hypothetical protein